jgi:uncharacterized protein (DUF1330 family)
MIVLTQLVYVVPGREADFHAFEDVVLPLLGKYGGALLLRVRPPADAVIAGTLEAPYEIHLVQFPDEDALARYGADDERQRVLHRKDASVRTAWLARGVRVA